MASANTATPDDAALARLTPTGLARYKKLTSGGMKPREAYRIAQWL